MGFTFARSQLPQWAAAALDSHHGVVSLMSREVCTGARNIYQKVEKKALTSLPANAGILDLGPRGPGGHLAGEL